MPETAKPAKKRILTPDVPNPRQKVTPEVYDQILLWYVNNGLQHAKAAKEFGLSRRTLTGLYYEGHPGLKKPPMKMLVDTVEVRARALRSQMKAAELKKADAEIAAIIRGTSDPETLRSAMNDGARARAEEAAVVAAGRKNILQLQGMLSPLLRGALNRLKHLEKDIEKLAPADLLKTLKDLAKFQNDLITAARGNMEMERLLLGTGGAPDQKNEIGPQDALRVIGLAARTHARYETEGRIIETEGEESEVATEPVFDPTAVAGDEDDEDEDDTPLVRVTLPG